LAQLEELPLIPGQLWPPAGGVEPVPEPAALGVLEPVESEPEVPELPVEAELAVPEVPEVDVPEPELVEPELVVAEFWVDVEGLAA
jgi:hypothetical protein